MKKLFLIPLLACFFCIGAYAAMTEVNVGNESSLREALAGAPTNGDILKINLTADIYGTKANALLYNPSAVTGRFNVLSGTNVILNLSSYGLGAEGFTLVNYWDKEPEDGIICYATILNFGTLTIVSEGDGTVSGAISSGAFYGGVPVITYGDLTINGGTFDCEGFENAFGVDVTGCLIWGRNGGTPIKITVNGGLFYANVADYAFGMLNKEENVTIEVNGGKFGKANKGSDPTEYLGEGCTVEEIDGVHWGKREGGYWVKPAGTESITENATIDEENNKQEAVYVAENVTLTIPEGQTLTITKDLAFKDETSQLIIEPNATVIIGDEVVTGSTNNIALTIDDKNKDYSNLLVAAGELQESHPKATVGFTTKCKQTPTKYIWQRFAVPTHVKYAVADIVRPDGVQTAICYYDEATSSWVNLQLGDTLQPFRCYSLTTTETEDGVEYTFPCELVGNGNPVLTLNAGWNYFANAYTAPMSLRDWLVDLMISDDYVIDEQRIIDGAVYVQAPSTRWNNFNAIDVLDEDFEEEYEDYVQLQPMQAFVYFSNVATTIPLKYKEYVYDPLVNNKHISLAAGAPRRRVALEDNFLKATISIKDENGDEELLRVYEGAQFTEDFDEDFDVYKLMNEDFFNAYFATPLGDLSRIALSNLDSTSFTFKTFEAGEFTMSFKSVTLEDYAVKDNLTGTVTELKKGNEYQFSGDANQLYSDRFIILKNGSATAVENVETTQTKKGVYTLTGQYVGKDLNSLPAGVYVVNGKKVVR